MILLAHMLFGAAIGSSVHNVTLAIILALLGHYFLDMFPHIEYLESTENSVKELKKDWKKNLPKLIKVLFDFGIGIALILAFSKNQPIIYLCALIAIIPDGITVINSLFPNKLLTKHQEIHGGPIHYLTKQKKFSKFWKIATQVIVVIISVTLLKF